VKAVEVRGGEVRVGGEVFLENAPGGSRRIARQLEDLAQRPREDRARAIRAGLAAALDSQAAAARIEEFRRRTRWLRIACNALFVHLFALAPALVIRYDAPLAVLVVFPVLVFLMIAICTLYVRAHRALLPDARAERIRNAAIMAFYPPLALRAADRIAAGALEGFHPLAAAVALCPREAWQGLARGVVLDLEHPILPACPAADPVLQAAEREWREGLLAEVETFLRRHQIDRAELVRPPAPLEAKCRTYCPRCRDQYVLAHGVCGDCGGLPLLPLPPRR
jgi:hypothetical protein